VRRLRAEEMGLVEMRESWVVLVKQEKEMGAVWLIWTLLQLAGMLSKIFWNFKSMQMVRMLIKANQEEAVLNVKREKVLP